MCNKRQPTIIHQFFLGINESVPGSGTTREQAPQGHKLPVLLPSRPRGPLEYTSPWAAAPVAVQLAVPRLIPCYWLSDVQVILGNSEV
jgi:hypothetical protein